MNFRVSKATEFRSDLGFKQHDIVLSKKQSLISKITKLFSNQNILLQHSVLGYRIGLHFPRHKLAIEVDDKGHTDRDKRKENEREGKTKEKFVCKFIRINPDEQDYDEYSKFGETNNHISESNKNLTKKFLIDKISKRLLVLEFEESDSIKSKCLKFIVKKKILSSVKNMQTYCPSFKRKKEKKISSKEEGTTYCLGCRDYTHNIGSKKSNNNK